MEKEKLLKKKCVPCEGGVPVLAKAEAQKLLSEVPGWELDRNAKSIRSKYRMKNFAKAVDFINRIAELAESENHHPDLHLTGFRNLTVELSTHAIGGLSENDFIVAAKINELPRELKKD